MDTSERYSVVLVGMMGCGKSTIGKLLARRLGWAFVDTDALIETEAGCCIREIFSEHGEPHFRRIERAAIAGLAESEQERVVAVGGGAVLNDENLDLLRQMGTLVYLKVSPRELARRVRAAKTRPLLVSCDDKVAAIAELLEARRARYEMADITVCTDGLAVKEAVAKVLVALGYREDRLGAD